MTSSKEGTALLKYDPFVDDIFAVPAAPPRSRRLAPCWAMAALALTTVVGLAAMEPKFAQPVMALFMDHNGPQSTITSESVAGLWITHIPVEPYLMNWYARFTEARAATADPTSLNRWLLGENENEYESGGENNFYVELQLIDWAADQFAIHPELLEGAYRNNTRVPVEPFLGEWAAAQYTEYASVINYTALYEEHAKVEPFVAAWAVAAGKSPNAIPIEPYLAAWAQKQFNLPTLDTDALMLAHTPVEPFLGEWAQAQLGVPTGYGVPSDPMVALLDPMTDSAVPDNFTNFTAPPYVDEYEYNGRGNMMLHDNNNEYESYGRGENEYENKYSPAEYVQETDLLLMANGTDAAVRRMPETTPASEMMAASGAASLEDSCIACRAVNGTNCCSGGCEEFREAFNLATKVGVVSGGDVDPDVQFCFTPHGACPTGTIKCADDAEEEE